MKLYSAPVRVVNNVNDDPNAVSVEIVGCSFSNPQSSNADILLGDGRTGKTSKGITTTITSLKTAASLQVQNPGDRTTSGYTGYSEDLSEGTNYQVTHTGSGIPSVVIIIPQPEPEPQPQPVVSSSGDGTMNNAFRVLFDTQGGTLISPATDLSYGDRVEKPADPTRDGYTFGGWYTDAECTRAWSFSESIPGGMTLYAKWTASSGGQTTTVTATVPATAPQTAKLTPAVVAAAATTTAPVTTTAAGISPTLTQALAPVFGALLGLLIAGVLLRRR